MKPWRAMRNAVQQTPLSSTATASAATESVSAASAIAPASRNPATTSVRRSPIRATIAPAGRLASSIPTPVSATIAAAVLTSAPRSRARSARTGRIAPCPMAETIEGPYATSQMSRKRKSVWVPEVTGPSSPRAPAER